MRLTVSKTKSFRYVFFMSLGLALGLPVAAQNEQKTSLNSVQGTTVTVEGKRKPRPSNRLLRHNPNTASSCSFLTSLDYGATESAIMADIIAAFRGNPTASTIDGEGLVYNDDGSISQSYGDYFSETSPFGNASIDGESASELFFSKMASSRSVLGSGTPGGCSAANAGFTAGRATIARRDKTLPEAFALFDAKKYPEALEMAKKSYAKLTDAEGGVEASLMIGKIYVFGLHGTVDVPEGLRWLERAAGARFDISRQLPPFDPKHPEDSLSSISEAAMLMAKIYLVGFEVEKSPKDARKWFERANYVGYLPAAKTLGDIYYYGYDTPKDIKKAISYYTQAAKFGFAPAQYSLGEIYYLGTEGIDVDTKTAVGWYYEASKQNHPGAIYALAHAYDAGEGVDADPAKAMIYYKDAALAGSASAQNAMGTYFYQGEQVSQDYTAARKWFEAAAVRGQVDGMFNLAVMMMKGEGGEADNTKAYAWLTLAQKAGHPNAEAVLKILKGRITPAEKAAAEALLSPQA